MPQKNTHLICFICDTYSDILWHTQVGIHTQIPLKFRNFPKMFLINQIMYAIMSAHFNKMHIIF